MCSFSSLGLSTEQEIASLAAFAYHWKQQPAKRQSEISILINNNLFNELQDLYSGTNRILDNFISQRIFADITPKILAAARFAIDHKNDSEIAEKLLKSNEWGKWVQTILDNGIQYSRSRKFNEAYECFKIASDTGFSHAQYYLGLCYLRGEGIGMNSEEAIQFLEKAAADRHIDASLFLATRLYQNDEDKRISHLKNAANFYFNEIRDTIQIEGEQGKEGELYKINQMLPYISQQFSLKVKHFNSFQRKELETINSFFESLPKADSPIYNLDLTLGNIEDCFDRGGRDRSSSYLPYSTVLAEIIKRGNPTHGLSLCGQFPWNFSLICHSLKSHQTLVSLDLEFNIHFRYMVENEINQEPSLPKRKREEMLAEWLTHSNSHCLTHLALSSDEGVCIDIICNALLQHPMLQSLSLSPSDSWYDYKDKEAGQDSYSRYEYSYSLYKLISTNSTIKKIVLKSISIDNQNNFASALRQNSLLAKNPTREFPTPGLHALHFIDCFNESPTDIVAALREHPVMQEVVIGCDEGGYLLSQDCISGLFQMPQLQRLTICVGDIIFHDAKTISGHPNLTYLDIEMPLNGPSLYQILRSHSIRHLRIQDSEEYDDGEIFSSLEGNRTLTKLSFETGEGELEFDSPIFLRNALKERRWANIAVAACFMRSNRDSYFKTSILPLLSKIHHFCEEPINDEDFKIDRFVNSRWFNTEILKGIALKSSLESSTSTSGLSSISATKIIKRKFAAD